tara:strand:+ start:1471 stop:2310 length:840 start_codon:yes stop_codon:yes gene_type:complete
MAVRGFKNMVFFNSGVAPTYYPVDLYNLLVYNAVGTVGSASSTRNIRLRNDSTNAEQDFLYDGTAAGKTAILTWLNGAMAEVVTLYNEGTGGSTYDFTQSNPARQPVLNTTTWLLDYNANLNVYLQTAFTSNTPILGADSTTIASFKTQNTLKYSGYFEEYQNNGRYVAIMSDTNSSLSSALDYRKTGLTQVNYSSQLAMNIDKVMILVYDNGVYSISDENGLIGSITMTSPFTGNTRFNLGIQTRGANRFNGLGKGIIVHNGLLSASITLELQTNIAI